MDKEIASLEQAAVLYLSLIFSQNAIFYKEISFIIRCGYVAGNRSRFTNTKWPAVRYFDYSDWGSGDTENTNEG